MTEKCFDIGTIQAFLDGELASDKLELVARHVSVCDDCAISLAEAEEESAFAFAALEPELNALVPTQRLWTKINHSIEQQRKPAWQNAFAFVSNFRFQISSQTVAGFASLLVVVGLLVTLLSLRDNTETNLVADTTQTKESVAVPITKSVAPIVQLPAQPEDKQSEKAANIRTNKNEFRAVKANFAVREAKPIQKSNPKSKTSNIPTDNGQPTTNERLSGEESYIKTIAALTETVSSRKDEVLNSSARFAFERDMAVTNDAIKKMRAEVKQNPKNEAARQILRASYQNKIDLLSSVAEKTELMASIK